MKKTAMAAVLGTLAGMAGMYVVLGPVGALGRVTQPEATAVAATRPPVKERWVCPMNDGGESDKPGRCPKCGMKLVKAEAKPAPAAGGQGEHAGHGHMEMGMPHGGMSATPAGKGEHAGHGEGMTKPQEGMSATPSENVSPTEGKEVWVCPMGHIVTDKPGSCPVCGMKLVKQKASPAKGSSVPGTVMLTAEKQQQIGVRSAEVKYVTLRSKIRAAGKVEADEARIHHVHTKVDGWIEKLFVNTTGQQVKAGQVLLTIYSPDLVAAQEEYLQAVKAEEQLGSSGLLPKGGGLVAAAKSRLRNWDFTEGDLADLRRTRAPKRAVSLTSHTGGIVIEKKALDGMRVMPGDEMFTITDLSRVWVQAQVYESELPYVKVGETATVRLEALPGRSFRGRVAFIYPTLDPMTRTAKVRVVLDNPGLVLKPEMYATATLDAPAQRHLAVPTEAVLDSGSRQVAFVAKPDGYFEPRVLKLGGYRGDLAIVKSGLKAGEKVVTSANFLIDSESQLQAAMGQMSGGGAHNH